MSLSTLRQRLARDESGFTLIELLVVLIIIGILLAIAVPSYLGFRERAQNRAAEANVRSAIPAAEAYYSDHGSYTGMTAANLKSDIDQGLKVTDVKVAADGKTYCLQSTDTGTALGTVVKHVNGPGGSIAAGACA